MEEKNLSNFMDGSIKNLFKDALQINWQNPRQALFLYKASKEQQAAAVRRSEHEEAGLHVPPFMIASITHRCNLKCAGCYAQATHKPGAEMDLGRLEKVFSEARELGISIILLAGGEPLVRREDVLKITAAFPEIIFPLFTNGTLFDEAVLSELKRQRNIIPVISIEGYQEDTDGRRGEGVYDYLKSLFRKMKGAGLFYGTSITLTRTNYGTVTDKTFLRGLMKEGCKLFFFIDYVPVKEGTEDWILTQKQQAQIPLLTASLRKELQGLFIAFPGDEEALGGCLAAGRGFVHVSPAGDLEPCPFAPYSDTSLKDVSLKEALESKLLKTIRDNHHKLTQTQGGCALWENREWLKSIISSEKEISCRE